ncbi:Neuropathy target esterase sws [Halotydeus destructor]|nr:Neuropathy target esterase sws [Halotydeus destructor]
MEFIAQSDRIQSVVSALQQWLDSFSTNEVVQSQMFLTVCPVLFVVAICMTVAFLKKFKKQVRETILPDPNQPRFRKRDKVMFFGRKIFRKVRTSLQAKTRGRKRQLVVRLAKRLLRLKRDQPLQLEVKEPSQAFLEEDITREEVDPRLPPEVIYMLKGVRVFGFFDKPLFLEICKHIEFVNVPKGKLLFSIGDPDDSIYIVQLGKLQVFLTESDGSELLLKEVAPGDTVVSLLSVLDVLSGHPAPFKTVSAIASEDSTLIRLQITRFQHLFDQYPESLVRVVQVIMVRLQRVTFTALHNYLGLTQQLVLPSPAMIGPNRKISQAISVQGALANKGSPVRPNRVSVIHQVEAQRSIIIEQEAIDQRNQIKSSASADSFRPPYGVSSADPGFFLPVIEAMPSPLFNVMPNPMPSVPPGKPLPESPTKQHRHSSILNPLDKLRKRKTSSIIPTDEKNVILDENDLQQMAVQGFKEQFGIDDSELIKSKILVREYVAGSCLIREETRDDTCLYYVISGCLVVSQRNHTNDDEINLFYCLPGEIVGALSVITGEASAFTIKAKGPCRVGVISEEDAYEILAKYPKSVLQLGYTVTRRLSPFVRQIDFALDWIHYESGRAVYRQGDMSDATWIVLSGRLRSVITRPDGKKELIGEYGKGDLVGIVEVLTQTERSTTIMAVRDTELAKLPIGLLDVIKIKYPVVVTRLIQLLGHRILGNIQKSGQALPPDTIGSRPSGSNFTTVAVLPVSDDVPLHAFCMELTHAASSIGTTLHLTSEAVRTILGPSALETSAEYRLISWLGQQEDRYRMVLYQCDSTLTQWTQRCIRQADCILIVGLADNQPAVGKVEKQLEHIAVRIQKELVLLHREGADKPKETVKWLNIRSWCASYHHIRCPKRVFIKQKSPKLKEYYQAFLAKPSDIHSDFSRLARFLTGTSIGLVLGGGGARGSAHVGMIQAIKEAGIPIDMVGGVSIGAFMGALWCQENDIKTFTDKGRVWSHGMTSLWKQIFDLTYPSTAMFTGAAFNRSIHEVFGDRQIEDLWLPYFTLTTDITSSSPRVHRFGSLWRYVRSSMSLSGYLPPLCDPVDGHLLLDGGYVNNLPADVMHHVMGAQTILAVDVGSQDETDLTNYGDQLSGWWLLWNKWNPFSKPLRVPNLPEIQSRLAYVSCVRLLEEVKQSQYCTYIRPPIDRFKTLQFGSFDEIMDVGYIHGKTLFSAMSMERKKSLYTFLTTDKDKKAILTQQGINVKNQASFTDLADKVCKIHSPNIPNTPNHYSLTDTSDCEDYDEDDEPEMYNSEPEFPTHHTDTENEHSSLRNRKFSTMY